MPRGGKRINAGRKPISKEESKALPNRSIRCTNEEYQAIKEYLKQLRKPSE